jgi:hypothetical protein
MDLTDSLSTGEMNKQRTSALTISSTLQNRSSENDLDSQTSSSDWTENNKGLIEFNSN